MNKAPKVLTRMRLSCCWGDNLNEKELNDVVDYINGLEQQCKKQKEVFDKLKEFINKYAYRPDILHGQLNLNYEEFNELLDILKEVSE